MLTNAGDNVPALGVSEKWSAGEAPAGSHAIEVGASRVQNPSVNYIFRVFGVRGPAKSAQRATKLWAIAESLVVQGRSSDLNQALMDLGATICTPAKPACARCPVAVPCLGRSR